MSSSRPHRCDEFPAEYSLASCSPAELASAFSAASCCSQQPMFVELSSANGNRGVSALSHSRGSLHGGNILGISPLCRRLPPSRDSSATVEMTDFDVYPTPATSSFLPRMS